MDLYFILSFIFISIPFILICTCLFYLARWLKRKGDK